MGATTRRSMLGNLGRRSPALLQARASETARITYPPKYSDGVMGPANVMEFEAIAKIKLSKWGYDYTATGVEDEITMRANRAAYSRIWIRRRGMIDVSKIDTSLEILG